VAPESQVLSTPTIIGWLNGMLSLVTFGLSSCDSGFGMNGKVSLLPSERASAKKG
jgi:hypothetical protein